MAISRCRTAARATSIVATFAHATKRINPTITVGRAETLGRSWARMGKTRPPGSSVMRRPPRCRSGSSFTSSIRRATPSKAASAEAAVTPAFSRPVTRNVFTVRSRRMSPCSSGAIRVGAVVGSQISATASRGVAPRKSGPATPKTVTAWPLMRKVPPIKSRFAPKSVVHKR